MSRLVLDAGAFVAVERGDRAMRARLAAARKLAVDVVTTSPVVAQVWRSGKQALIAQLIVATRIVAPDEAAARRAGELLGKSKTSDVVDALVVGLARNGDTIVTSDPDDIKHLLVVSTTSANVVVV